MDAPKKNSHRKPIKIKSLADIDIIKKAEITKKELLEKCLVNRNEREDKEAEFEMEYQNAICWMSREVDDDDNDDEEKKLMIKFN